MIPEMSFDGNSVGTNSSPSLCGDEQQTVSPSPKNAEQPELPSSSSSSSSTVWLFPLAVFLLFSIAVPLILLGTAQTTRRDAVISDLTVMAWCFLLYTSVAHKTFPQSLRGRTPIIVTILSMLVALAVYLTFVSVTDDPSDPAAPHLHNLNNTGMCEPFNPNKQWSNIACESIDYLYQLEPALQNDFTENGTQFSIWSGIPERRIQGIATAMTLGHVMSLVVPILSLTIPRADNITDTNVDTYVHGCTLALETYTCARMFRPCLGSCNGSRPPCASSCQSVLAACPGVESGYDLIAPGSDLRPTLYADKPEFYPLHRALDRMLLSLKHRCGDVDDPNVLLAGVPPSCTVNLSYTPTDEGMCNPNTRASLERDNAVLIQEHENEVNRRLDRIQRLEDVRRGLPFALFFCVIGVNLCLALCCSKVTLKEQLRSANEFWYRWWDITPKLTHLATPIQLSVSVGILLMARHVETTTDHWYVATIETIVSVVLLRYTVETVLCYVRLEDECSTAIGGGGDESGVSQTHRRTTILYEVSVYGRYFARKVCAQEALEVVIQFTYFFVAISTTDEVTVIVQATVLFVNLVVTPYLMMTRRSSVVLFDAVFEGLYLTINISNAVTRDENTQSLSLISILIETTSLCLSSWGCVTSLYILSQYYFHYTYTGMVVMKHSASPKNGRRIVVRSVDENEMEDAPSAIPNLTMPQWSFLGAEEPPAEPSHQHPTVLIPPDGPSKKVEGELSITHQNVKLQDAKSTVNQRALIPVGRTTRRIVCAVTTSVAVVFFVSTMVRVGLQEQRCRELVGDELWSKVSPKLLFPDGFAATTRCYLSVTTRLDLSDGDAETVPDGLRYFTSLTHLDLSRNWLTRVPADSLVGLPLQHLDLSFNRITWVHPSVLDVPPLTFASFEGNPFAKRIDWSGSDLETIPRHLVLLNSTDVLLLSHNRLTSISIFDGFVVKDTLDLSYNNLTELPSTIFSRMVMTTLNVSFNHITATSSMGPGFAVMGVSEIDIRNNRLNDLPSVFAYAARLPTSRPIIHLGGNNITTIDLSKRSSITVTIDMAFLKDIKNDVVRFDASNQINAHGAPLGLANSTSVRYLNLSDVAWGLNPRSQSCRPFQYTEWWRFINSLPALEVLDISVAPAFRRFCLLPPKGTALHIPTLKTLWVRGSTPQGLWHCERCFGSPLPAIEEIDISGYNVTAGSTTATRPFPEITRFKDSLRRLYVDRSVLQPAAGSNLALVLSQLRRLTLLSLRRTDIVSLSDDLLSSLGNLRVLDVSGSSMMQLPTAHSLDHIETVDFTGTNKAVVGGTLDAEMIVGSGTSRRKCAFFGSSGSSTQVLPTLSSGTGTTPSWVHRLHVLDISGASASSFLRAAVASLQHTTLRKVCVSSETDLSACVELFGNKTDVCARGPDMCRDDPICGAIVHTYSPFSEELPTTSDFCGDCDSTCAREIIFSDSPTDSVSRTNSTLLGGDCETMNMTTSV
eukprot:PhM_4_TR9799/c6_g1_i1/m.24046